VVRYSQAPVPVMPSLLKAAAHIVVDTAVPLAMTVVDEELAYLQQHLPP
jgi:hypothetical protein